jgi:hypothetical protein
MAWFTYHGLTKAQVAQRLESYMKQIAPPVVRGEEDNPYYPDKQDDPDKVEWKRKNHEAWMNERKEEYHDGLKVSAVKAAWTWAPYHLGGVRRSAPKSECKTITFDVGVPQEVEDSHWMYEKLTQLAAASKKSKHMLWSKSAKAPAAPKEEPKPKAKPKVKE